MSFLVARDVGFGYAAKGRTVSPTVLSHFDLAITQGEFFCLLGPSGCGKTTVLNLMAGFQKPTSGTLTLDERPITGDRKSTRLNSSHIQKSRMPSSA